MKQLKLKYLLQQLFMLTGILKFVFDPLNSAIRTSLAPFAAACTVLQTMVKNLEAKIAKYRLLLKSYSASKRAARTALAEAGYPIISTARSYCIKSGRMADAEQLTTSLKELKSMTFELLLSKSSSCINIITPLLPELATYNITADSMEIWNARHTELYDLLNAPSIAYKQRTDLGKEIVADMRAIMSFFNNELSPLVGNFYNTHNAFYTSFQSIKKIGTPNIHHTRLLAHVISEIGTPYPGLTVVVDTYTDPETGKTYDADRAITDAEGNCEVSAFFPAMRTVTISGPGVMPSTFPAIRFKKGKAVSHQFVMQPAMFNIPAHKPDTQKTNA